MPQAPPGYLDAVEQTTPTTGIEPLDWLARNMTRDQMGGLTPNMGGVVLNPRSWGARTMQKYLPAMYRFIDEKMPQGIRFGRTRSSGLDGYLFDATDKMPSGGSVYNLRVNPSIKENVPQAVDTLAHEGNHAIFLAGDPDYAMPPMAMYRAISRTPRGNQWLRGMDPQYIDDPIHGLVDLMAQKQAQRALRGNQ